MSNLVSFEISSDFGFFKKPDINKIGLTYNLPPKPAILGIIGSVLGMNGIEKQDGKCFPEYYTKLEHVKVGVTPIGDFPFNKIVNTYNSRNSYFGDGKYDNVLIHEQLLIKPKYRIFVYDENQNQHIAELIKRLEAYNPLFMPYLGKNEFIISFDNINTKHSLGHVHKTKHISSVFIKNTKYENKGNVADEETTDDFRASYTVNGLPTGFSFIENYPTDYSEEMHYNLRVVEFAEKSSPSSIDLEKGKLLEIDGDVIYIF